MRKSKLIGLAVLAASLSLGLSAAPATVTTANKTAPGKLAQNPVKKIGHAQTAEQRETDAQKAKARVAKTKQSVDKSKNREVNNRFPAELLTRKPVATKQDVLVAKQAQAKNKMGAFGAAVLNTPAADLSFPGYDNDDNAAVAGGRIAPPDTNGDVGTDYYVQYVNLGWMVFSKTDGSVVAGPFRGNTFWEGFGGICESDNSGDPIVLYDRYADRWVFSQFTTSSADGHQCFAVSKDNKPFPDPGESAADQYHRYDFVVSPSGQFNDYPKITLWPDGYYMTTNEFTSGFVGVNLTVFNRSAMLAGAPANFVQWGLGADDTFSSQTAHLEGLDLPPPGTCNTVIHASDAETWGSPFDSYRSWQACVDFSNPGNSTLTENPRVATAAFDAELCGFSRNCVPTPTGQSLDTLGQFTMYRFTTRYFPGEGLKGVISHTVDVGGNRAGIRWAQLNLGAGGPSIADQGTIDAGDGMWRWMPAAGMDASGNIAVVYTKANAGKFPSVYFAGREAGDAPGTMQAEAVCHDGTGGQTGANRWGDYASVSSDPVDQCTFWMTNEYTETTGTFNWNTRVCSFKFPSCGEPTFGLGGDNLTQEVCTATGATLNPINVNVASYQDFNDPVTLSYDGLPAGFSGGFSNNPVVPPGSSIAQLFADGSVTTGVYNFRIRGVAGSTERFANVSVRAWDSVPAGVALNGPADGATGVDVQPAFSWSADAEATSYTIEIDDNADFSSPEVSETVNGTSFTPAAALDTDTTYYWRVTANNTCGSGVSSSVFSFSTGLLVCTAPNVAIPDSNVAGVSNTLLISEAGTLDDLNVSVKGVHTWVGDLKFNLTHIESGLSVDLIDRPGVPNSTFGCSANDFDTTLDDAGSAPVETTCNATPPALSGSLIPNQPLSTFNGGDYAGSWRLTVSDLAGGDTGTLQKWCLLPVLAPVAGDLNGDRCVDINDMSLLLAAIRNRSTDPMYDINGDGKVNSKDRTALQALYSNPGGAPCN